MIKKLLIAPVFLLLVACGTNAETARERYIIMEYAVEGAANSGVRAVQREVIEPGSEEAHIYSDALDTAGTALDEANLQLKMGEFDNALQYLQVGSAALAGVRPLVDRVLGEE